MLNILEPYNYGETEIHSLIKRCAFDEERIQMEVLKIIEEHESWDHTATASERKDKKSEATERRLQREKEQAEEMERLKEQRKKQEDDRQRRLREEAERRRKEADEKRLSSAGQGAKGMPRNAGGASAWRVADTDEAPTPDKGNEDADQGWGNERTDGAASPIDETPQDESGEAADAEFMEDEQTPVAENDWAPPAQMPAAVEVAAEDPPEKATGSSEGVEVWNQPPAMEVAHDWTNEKSWPSDGNHWSAPTTQDNSVHAVAEATAATQAVGYGDGSGDASAVIMPPAYAAFFASYPEPKLAFGSLRVNGNSGHR